MQDCIKLLPYSSKTIVNDVQMKIRIFELIRILIIESIAAINDFESGHLPLFDPHIGECACQIRAYKTLLIYKHYEQKYFFAIRRKKTEFDTLLNTVNPAIEKLKATRYKKKNRQIKLEIKNILSFIKDEKIYFDMSDDLYFLIVTHFLSKFKFMLNDEPIIDYEKIRNELSLSKDIARRLVHKYQKAISLDSYKFVLHLSIHDSELSQFSKMIKFFKRIDEEGRTVLPTYLTAYIIFYHMKKNQHKFKLSMHENENNISITKNFIKQPVMVFKFCYQEKLDRNTEQEKFENDLRNFGIEKIILSNMAAHPQYPGKKLESFKSDPFTVLESEGFLRDESFRFFYHQFQSMRDLAVQYGYIQKNFTLPFVKHIYTDFISLNQSNKIILPNNEYYSAHSKSASTLV